MSNLPFKPTCVVLFSGGLDSGVLTHELLAAGESVLGLNAKYGTKHNPHEQTAVNLLDRHFRIDYPGKFQVRRYDLELAFVHATGPMFHGDPAALPTAHFEDDAQRATVVPGRNLVLIAVAASLAEQVGASRVVIGAHAGDHFIYPDCRPAFLLNASLTVSESTDDKVRLNYPFQFIDKAAIVKRGMAVGFPFQLSRTCYSDWTTACGVCGSCNERIVSFAANGMQDPLPYAGNPRIPAPAGGVGGNPV